MNINDAFPSTYLKCEDLQGKNATVTIATVRVEDIGQGANKERKVIIGLVGKQKEFVCNKTNKNTIVSLYGQETNNWINQKITLTSREVEFQGSMVWAIRVSLQKPALTAPAVVAPPPVKNFIPDDSDSVPF